MKTIGLLGLLLLGGCFHDSVTAPVITLHHADHTGDPCWYVADKLPLKPPAQGDTLYVWAHIAGCKS